MLTWDLLKTSLRVLQLEDYSSRRWWRWYRHKVLTRQTEVRRSLVWTSRLKGLVFGSLTFWLMGMVLGFSFTWWAGVLVFLIGILVPGVWVGSVNCLFRPADKYVHKRRLLKISDVMAENPKTEVIGVVGSFGKTTVKEILFSILDRVAPTLMTAENFNTAGGIYRVLSHELIKQKYFVAEMGAYVQGDIRDLVRAVGADWGVITGIGAQHLERFGSLEATAQAKSEIIDQGKPRHVIVNWDSQPLREYILKKGLQDKVLKLAWQQPNGDFNISQVVQKPNEIRFRLSSGNKAFNFSVPLFGTANVYNAALAASLALSIGTEPQVINEALLKVQPLAHRLQVTKRNKAWLIDNTYSSNVVGFKQVMEDLRRFTGSKALVTPGLVELGEITGKVHHQLGQIIASTFDEIVLVGKSERTRALCEGFIKFKFKGQYSLIDPGLDLYWQAVEVLTNKYDWVLLENDLPEQYY